MDHKPMKEIFIAGYTPCFPPDHRWGPPQTQWEGRNGDPSQWCAHTLHHAPGVLPGLCHLVADFHLFSAANHCKGEMDLPGNTGERAVFFPSSGKDWLSTPSTLSSLLQASGFTLVTRENREEGRSGRRLQVGGRRWASWISPLLQAKTEYLIGARFQWKL